MYSIITNLQNWFTGQVTEEATGKDSTAKPKNDKQWKWDNKPIVSSGSQTEPLIKKENNFNKLKKKAKKAKKCVTGNVHIDYSEVLKSPLEVLKEQREFEKQEVAKSKLDLNK